MFLITAMELPSSHQCLKYLFLISCNGIFIRTSALQKFSEMSSAPQPVADLDGEAGGGGFPFSDSTPCRPKAYPFYYFETSILG